MPSSVDLPTPEPANRPTRWPRPIGSSALIARTPTSNGWVIGSRASGLIDTPAMPTCPSARIGPLPSSGTPSLSITRPSRPSPTATPPRRAEGTTRALGSRPCSSALGIS
ncbi:hypothetical protein G6F40_016692 [Rhizopus arrhizus]|nr:hypothetical protein G6F40_016692 [Rhizopus arrhizus]